ncbi:histidine kinase [Novosphingobium sp. PC22D]|uniref:CHASE domain-containing protein n=1 Tax=Novosphingobium sp. PC22D TaxID=1962403 RepID=UPI000BEF5637|nr:CHASE domain-containing protein [Novosphingobium sp. PC22D]PEQ13886.1 histidine kinase [Novosphingobium sp. PC22D]
MIDEALLERVRKQAWFHTYPRGWPLLLFLVASIGTAVSVIAIERADRQTRQIELDRNSVEISGALQRRIIENIALLRAGAALFATQDQVSAEEFNEFVSDLQSNGNLYGSLGMGWAPLLRAEDVPYFEFSMREQGLDGFTITPPPIEGQDFSTPVFFLQPLTAANRRAIGYDMYSEPVRREAMVKAAELRKPVASGKVHLVQDRGEPDAAGFLIYVPVVINSGGGERVKGFIYSPFRASDFLDSAAELYSNENIQVAIYDGSVAPDNLLARNATNGELGASQERSLDVGNHSWTVVVRDKKFTTLSTLSRITLFFGIIASLLVMAIGRLITKRATEDRRVLEWLTNQASIRNSLTRELNHRVKNTLANVLSIAALTRRRARDLDDFTESLTARIRALSATHDLLSQSDWANAPLGEIVKSELAPYMEGNESHVEMEGPEILLAPNDAMSLGLAIHELATNAAKYGGLSTIDGRIHVSWKLLTPGLAEICWRESGGPEVKQPTKRGFGRDLIEKIVAHELRSDVDLQFLPGGVRCRLQVPVRATRAFELRRKPEA